MNHLVPDSYGKTNDEKFAAMEAKLSQRKPGETGLLALDWNNGNRTILVDVRLSGMILGQTLHTEAHEIYRTLIEATAFGALTIIKRIEEYGVTRDDQYWRARGEERDAHANLRGYPGTTFEGFC